MKPIIKVENLSKQYRIGTAEATRYNLREALTEFLKAPIKRRKKERRPTSEIIWALKDVSFNVEPGEVVGLIGKNGAGKSTLLKVLSRITEPTSGRVELYGRIGSLLEVGTGFHPELTGRENVFLNGAILGMGRAEIARKFDEIVAFSEIEKFIDTPVKWYSSGMYLRLAFAVAAHLEPEILFLDEVLAVGDMAFQFKCFNKIQQIKKDGCTILFVSHSMQAVDRLCKRTIYLSNGSVVGDGPSPEIANAYLSTLMSSTRKIAAERRWEDPHEAPGNEVARLCSVRIHTAEGDPCSTIDIDRPVAVRMEYEVLEPGHLLAPNFHFYTEAGVLAFITNDLDPRWRLRPRPKGHYSSTAWIPGNFLAEGILIVAVCLSTHDPVRVHFFETDAIAFQVRDVLNGETARGDYKGEMGGAVRPLLNWETEFVPNASEEAPRSAEDQIVLRT
jgi:lipopolysaccharide transport system ATP-binding protein